MPKNNFDEKSTLVKVKVLYDLVQKVKVLYDLVQKCCISIALAMEIPQSCTKLTNHRLTLYLSKFMDLLLSSKNCLMS